MKIVTQLSLLSDFGNLIISYKVNTALRQAKLCVINTETDKTDAILKKKIIITL